MLLNCYIITLLYGHDNCYCFSFSSVMKAFATLYVFMVMQIKLQPVAKVVETSYLNETKLFAALSRGIFLPFPLPNVASYAI